MGITLEYRIKEDFNDKILSVIFDADSFFYCVTDHNNNLCSAVKYQLESNPLKEISEIIKKESLQNYFYTSVNIFSKRPSFTFIPMDEYNYEHETSFAKNAFCAKNGKIIVDLFDEERIYILHEIEFGFQESLSLILNENRVKHVSLAWMEAIKEDGIYVFYEDILVSILVRRNNKLLYYNQFSISTVHDAFYFILLSWQQLDLNNDNFEVFLDGTCKQIPELKLLLSKYILKISTFRGGFANVSSSSDILDLYFTSICE